MARVRYAVVSDIRQRLDQGLVNAYQRDDYQALQVLAMIRGGFQDYVVLCRLDKERTSPRVSKETTKRQLSPTHSSEFS